MESAAWRWLLAAGCAVTLLLTACGGGGGGGTPSTAPTTSGGGGGAGGSGAGGGGSPPAPSRTPLVRALSLDGEATSVHNVTPVPPGAVCTISALLYFEDGTRRAVSSTRRPDRSNPHQVVWSLDLNPEPVGAKWDMRCTAPDPSQPGGRWVGHGSAALGVFPPPTPASPSAAPSDFPSSSG